jgi:hypothetical protein
MPSRNEQVAAILSKLALHYWRPDFTPTQSKLVLSDFFADLARYTPAEISDACDTYRRNGENRFFPTPGALLALLKPDASERPRLPTFRAGQLQIGGRKATKSVAEVLREHGFERQAEKWEGRDRAIEEAEGRAG